MSGFALNTSIPFPPIHLHARHCLAPCQKLSRALHPPCSIPNDASFLTRAICGILSSDPLLSSSYFYCSLLGWRGRLITKLGCLGWV
ncbi:hypothetical protein DV515_00001726 [Chloebia gouldiae]|uniref:Uncharacterized protein n=1 Tax=Chloebia gouldiae TaxID=44316 RepID=A0A3L8SYW7_CHLGU|nr:hypothetical protein DV515_00001726 [Chloebia gouldiae]